MRLPLSFQLSLRLINENMNEKKRKKNYCDRKNELNFLKIFFLIIVKCRKILMSKGRIAQWLGLGPKGS